jgi:ribonuclease Z
MFDLTFLGTSASVPSADRNHPGLLVSAGNTRILVDCGEGTQRQLLRSGAGFRRLRRLLLTHGHLDHILGIPGLLSTMGTQQSLEKLVINGGRHTLQVVVRMLAGLWGEGQAPVPLELVAMSDFAVIQEDTSQSRLFLCATATRIALAMSSRAPGAVISIVTASR